MKFTLRSAAGLARNSSGFGFRKSLAIEQVCANRARVQIETNGRNRCINSYSMLTYRNDKLRPTRKGILHLNAFAFCVYQPEHGVSKCSMTLRDSG